MDVSEGVCGHLDRQAFLHAFLPCSAFGHRLTISVHQFAPLHLFALLQGAFLYAFIFRPVLIWLQADTYVVAFRRWSDEYGGGGPWGPIDESYLAKLDPRLPREALLDRWVIKMTNLGVEGAY